MNVNGSGNNNSYPYLPITSPTPTRASVPPVPTRSGFITPTGRIPAPPSRTTGTFLPATTSSTRKRDISAMTTSASIGSPIKLARKVDQVTSSIYEALSNKEPYVTLKTKSGYSVVINKTDEESHRIYGVRPLERVQTPIGEGMIVGVNAIGPSDLNLNKAYLWFLLDKDSGISYYDNIVDYQSFRKVGCKVIKQSEVVSSKSENENKVSRKVEDIREKVANLSDETADVKFIVEGREIKAHRCWLEQASEHFKDIFKPGFKEAKEKVATIEECSFDSFKLIMDFIYGRSITIDLSNVLELYHLSDRFLLTDLNQLCAEAFTKLLREDTALDFFIALFPHAVSHALFLKQTLNFLEENTTSVFKQNSEAIARLDEEQLKWFLRQDRLNIKELDLFLMLDKWIEFKSKDAPLSQNEIDELLAYIRFEWIGVIEFISCAKTSKCLAHKSESVIQLKGLLANKLFNGNLGRKERSLLNAETNLEIKTLTSFDAIPFDLLPILISQVVEKEQAIILSKVLKE